jgi:hypothetical protein
LELVFWHGYWGDANVELAEASNGQCAACSVSRVCQAVNVSGSTVVATSTNCGAGSTVIVETLEVQSL